MGKTKLRLARENVEDKPSQEKVIDGLIKLGRMHNVPVMSRASLKVKLSRWENGHDQVSTPYRRLFREYYGRENDELGFPPEPVDHDTDELLSRLDIARTVDAATVELFSQQVEQARRIDRQFGAVTQLDGLRALIQQVQDLLCYSPGGQYREAIATVLAEAAALAGWEALDRNALRAAWDHHETAKAAAREAGSPHRLTHAMAQQAFILIDLDRPDQAIRQLAEARELADHTAPRLLRAWTAAAHGEGLAAAGHHDDALRAFDAAHDLLPNDPVGVALPFLFLAGAHLDRWRGNALAKLGDPDAITQLSEALPRLPAEFTRARAAMLTDLAHAQAASGDRDNAVHHARQAKHLATQIKSDRLLRRLQRIVIHPSGT